MTVAVVLEDMVTTSVVTDVELSDVPAGGFTDVELEAASMARSIVSRVGACVAGL